MLLVLVNLLLLSGSVLCYKNCSYPWLIEHLRLTSKKELFTLSRPVEDPADILDVIVNFKLERILDVKEADQTLISFISIETIWSNEYITWDGLDCDIQRITVPMELLWRPDLGIYEEVEKDKSSQGSFLVITDSYVAMKTDQVIVSMCKMDVYKFPFDTQHCNLSIKSFIHTSEEIQLKNHGDSKTITDRHWDSVHSQYEWLFQKIDVAKTKGSIMRNTATQDILVYTITMSRRSMLYVVNFILPVLFFLGLDYATFLMADGGGDKLAFKITILLAVTVLQLLLNDILPSSSDNIPLIAVFCIGVFILMKLSLLETIVVMYLLERDSKGLSSCKGKTAQEDAPLGWKCTSWFKCIQKNSSDDLLSHHMNDKEVEDKENMGSGPRGSDVDRLLHELRILCEVLSEAVGGSKEDGYWRSRICVINRVFLVCHSACTALFLGVIFSKWFS